MRLSEIFADLPITFENLRVIFGNLRKSPEGFGSSSEIVGSLRVNFALFGSPRVIFGNLRSNFSPGKPKLTKNALCLNQSEFSNFALYVIRYITYQSTPTPISFLPLYDISREETSTSECFIRAST